MHLIKETIVKARNWTDSKKTSLASRRWIRTESDGRLYAAETERKV
jgi:hypothetical protein